MDNSETYFDGEINVRDVLSTIWRGRWVIIALTLVAGIAAFSVSTWVIPEKYQATALIAIDKPAVQFKDINDILYSSSIPNAEYIQELATSESFLENVTASSDLVPYWDSEKDSIMNMLEVVIIGGNQLSLNVFDVSPERVALVANVWAAEITAKINRLYGVEVVANTLDDQVIQSQEDYIQAQDVLESELLQNEASIIALILEETMDELSCVLSRSSAAKRILEDLQVLRQGLSGLPVDNFLSLGDAIALTTLQQRTSASQICASETQNTLLQVGNDTLIEIKVIDALDSIAHMRDALQTQQITLSDEQIRLEEIIPSLERNLANEDHQLGEQTMIRDQTLEIYNTLLEQQGRVRNILLTNTNVATVSVPAIVPDEPIGPKVLMNTIIAGTFGLMLGFFWVFVVGWWQSNEHSVDLDVSEGE